MSQTKFHKTVHSLQNLLGLESLGEVALRTAHGDYYLFSLRPPHVCCLSDAYFLSELEKWQKVWQNNADIELFCTSLGQTHTDRQDYLKKRQREEKNPVVSQLLEQDLEMLDRWNDPTQTQKSAFLLLRTQKKGLDAYKEARQYLLHLQNAGLQATLLDADGWRALLHAYFLGPQIPLPEESLYHSLFPKFQSKRSTTDA